MAKDAAVGVKDDVVALAPGGDRRQPLQGGFFVDLYAEARGGLDDPRDLGGGSCGFSVTHVGVSL